MLSHRVTVFVLTFLLNVFLISAGAGEVYIQNIKIQTDVLTNGFRTGFDEIGFYNFTGGEILEFTCKASKPGNVTMVYYDKGNKTVIPGINKKPSSMFLKLTSQRNGTYIDCRVNVDSNNDLTTTRIYLYQRKTDVGYLGFKINDQTLLPVKTKIRGVNCYEYYYEYFDGEKVYLATTVDINHYDNMNCLVTGVSIPENIKHFQHKIQINDIRQRIEMRKENNNLRFLCSIHVKQAHLRVYFAINFIYYDENTKTDFNPLIIGLPWSNILLKYNKNDHLRYIYYEYKDNEVLKLRCTPKDNENSNWKFNETEVTSTIVIWRQNKIAETRTFAMNEEYNETLIICNGDDAQTVLTLRRTGYIPYYEEKASVEVQDELRSGDGKSEKVIYTIIGVLVGVIIISLAVWMAVMIYKRRQKAEQTNSSTINYENLPEHRNGPMPIPQQWQCQDEPTYSSPADVNIEAMYTKPVPKQLRPRIESAIYSEVQYAEPILTDNQFSKTVLKETGGINSKGDSLHYANIKHDTQNGSDKNSLEKGKDTKVMEDKSAEKRDDKYENIFDNQKYENFHSQKESIEPAYCEMYAG